MAYKFNPFTGNLDEVSAGGGGGGTPGGSTTQIQFNDAGSFGGDVDLTWNKTTNVMTVAGDVNLSDGGTYTTTLQTITPTANRTVSIPDATGTVALVAGSSGQLVYNNAGAYAGASSSAVGATGNITLSLAGAASTPPVSLTGTWFSGGTSTTTKPQFLIEPSGTTSTAWNTSGTGLGVNAASGFAGRLIDLQVNGTSYFQIVPGVNSSTLRLFGSSGWDNYIRSKSTAGAGFNIETNLGLTGRLEFGVVSGTTGAGDTFIARDAAGILAQRNGANAQTYRLYNTYTDASNYERGYLSWDTNEFKIGVEQAGSGVSRAIKLATNSSVVIQSGGTVQKLYAGTLERNASGNHITWSNSVNAQTGITSDIGLKRDQAGVVAITDGSTGTGYLKQTPVAVSALPAAATVGAGTRGFVSDSTVAASGNFGATVTGGGSNNVPVFSDGTNWLIG